MEKKLLPFILFIFLGFSAYCQRYIGVSTSNYNTLNSMYLNPANLGGCNEKLAISLFSMNVGADNSLGTIKSIGDITKTLHSGDSASTKDIFTYSNRSKFSMMLPAVEVRGPGVLYRINSRHTLAFTTRVRAFNEFNNFDQTLYKTITDNNYAQQGGANVTAQNFNWTAHLWSELGLSYGGVLLDNDLLQLKAGITLRYLIGIGYLGLKGKNLDVYYKNGSDSFSARNSDIEFGSNAQSVDNAVSNGAGGSKILGGNSGGKGFGADIGAIVSLLPEADNSKDDAHATTKRYRLALSAAITDIGSISYKTSYNVNVTGNGYLTGNGLVNHIKDYNDFRNYIKTQGFNADTGIATAKVYMPTMLVLGGDFHAYKHFYANATLFTSLADQTRFGSRYYNQLTITPRFDSKILTVGLPLTYNMLTNNMRMGIGFRISGLYFGSDDMMALFSGNQYGFNFYFGAMIPIFRSSK
jgi:hypothetical protein